MMDCAVPRRKPSRPSSGWKTRVEPLLEIFLRHSARSELESNAGFILLAATFVYFGILQTL